MKRLTLLLLALSLPSCSHISPYHGPPITGSIEYQGLKLSGTIHPTK